jgi:alpha-glucosidase
MAQSSYSLRSPDQRIEVRIHTAGQLRYDVLLNGTLLLQNSRLSMSINHINFGTHPIMKSSKQRSENKEIISPVPQKSARIREHYNELRLETNDYYAIVFRAFNEGVAYRFETSLNDNQVRIDAEEARLNFAGDYNVYYPKEDSFFSHNEREFLNLPLKQITPTTLASLPAVVVANNGVKIAIAESDVEDYPGLWLRGGNNNALEAVFRRIR